VTTLLIVKLLHLLLFVYWLGADAGTFYAARFIAKRELTVPARATAAKIMLGIDVTPRICMPLTLATGVHLAWLMGALPVSGWWVAATWLLGLNWLAMVLALHQGTGSPWAARLTSFDFRFRIVLVVALLALAIGSFAGMGLNMAPWLALKVACYALTIVCGLMIRIHLRPFGPAFGALMKSGATPEIDAAIANSISRCVPYVLAIWVLLVVCAAAGLHLLG
jgi:hypothetical protein